MVGAAEKKLGLDPAHIVSLGEKRSDRGRACRRRSRDGGSRAAPGDLVFILLIGHGSFQQGESRFNLPGPDMTAADFVPLLDALAAQTVVFVNTASASGDFVKALAGKDRTIVTATKSAQERNETTFAQHFVDAFADRAARTRTRTSASRCWRRSSTRGARCSASTRRSGGCSPSTRSSRTAGRERSRARCSSDPGTAGPRRGRRRSGAGRRCARSGGTWNAASTP